MAEELPDHGAGDASRECDDCLLVATDRFCAHDTHDRLTRTQFEEAFTLLANRVRAQTLQVIARSLAAEPATPRFVAIALALEAFPIAEPMLHRSTTLGQLDLLRVAHLKGGSHAAAIATRSDVGHALERTLRAMGDAGVNAALADNPVLAPITVTRTPVLEAQPEAAVRAEEPAPLPAPAPAKGVETDQTGEPARPVGNARATQALLEAAARGGRLTVERQRPAPEEPQEAFAVALEAAVRRGKRGAAMRLLQSRMGLSRETVETVMEDSGGDTLCVAMKAMDVEAAVAGRILLLAFPQIGLSVHNAQRSMRLYKRLTTEGCAAAVAQWPKGEDAANDTAPVERRLPARREVEARPIAAAEEVAERRTG